ncbi:MAG: tetratricopeptide repeat protein [Phycisphaerae bacterium]|nr:tetratricopeptide repeat protein [Phycisphaerae bacterium]
MEKGVKRRDEWIWLAAVLLSGLVLRASYLIELTGEPDFAHPTAIDSDYHDEWAVGLATGVWSDRLQTDPHIKDTAYFRPPGYAYFLAGVYALFGHSYLAARLIQMLFGLGTVVVLWRLGRSWLGPPVGLAAAALAATFWPFIYYEAELHEVSLLVLLAGAILLVLARQVGRPSVLAGLAAGVLIGLFAIVRPNILLFAPVGMAWCWWNLKKATGNGQQASGRRTRGARFDVVAGLVVGAVLPIIPVTVRNFAVAREFVLISSNAGMQLRIGNNIDATGLADGYLPELEELTGLDGWTTYDIPRIHRGVEREAGREMTASQVSHYFTSRTWDYIRNHPLDWLALTGRKFLFFWGPMELDSNKELHYARQESIVLRCDPVGFTPILAGAIVGIVLAWRRRNPVLQDACGEVRRGTHPTDREEVRQGTHPADREEVRRGVHPGQIGSSAQAEACGSPVAPTTVLLVLFVLFYWLSFALFSVTTRYRLPLVPALILLCAVAGVAVWKQAAQSRKGAFFATAGAWALLGLILSIRFVPYEPDLAKWHYFRGAAYERAGELERALPRYLQSLDIDPDNPRTHFSLAGVLARLGHPEEALAEWREAVRLKPDYLDAYVNMGTVLAGLGREGEAIDVLRKGIAKGSRSVAAYGNLASLLASRGELDEARKAATTGLAVHPESALLCVALGQVEARSGNLESAREQLEQAVGIDPQLPQARLNLGLVYKELGRTGDAIEQYTTLLEQSPDDVFARHNLAVALAERGDLPAAVEQFREVIKRRPDLALTHAELAAALIRERTYAEALDELKEARRLNPELARTYLYQARCLIGLGRLAEAKTAFESYLARNPGDAQAARELADLAERMGETEGAAEVQADTGDS